MAVPEGYLTITFFEGYLSVHESYVHVPEGIELPGQLKSRSCAFKIGIAFSYFQNLPLKDFWRMRPSLLLGVRGLFGLFIILNVSY